MWILVGIYLFLLVPGFIFLSTCCKKDDESDEVSADATVFLSEEGGDPSLLFNNDTPIKWTLLIPDAITIPCDKDIRDLVKKSDHISGFEVIERGSCACFSFISSQRSVQSHRFIFQIIDLVVPVFSKVRVVYEDKGEFIFLFLSEYISSMDIFRQYSTLNLRHLTQYLTEISVGTDEKPANVDTEDEMSDDDCGLSLSDDEFEQKTVVTNVEISAEQTDQQKNDMANVDTEDEMSCDDSLSISDVEPDMSEHAVYLHYIELLRKYEFLGERFPGEITL
jgi:hypothetical protein